MPLAVANGRRRLAGAQVHRLAEHLADDLERGADHGIVARCPDRLLAGLDPDGTRVVVLAERARIAKQTAVALIDRLEEGGVVERVRDPADGRARLVRLSPAGEQALRAARAAEEEIERRWTEHLGVRRMRELRETLERLRSITDTG